MTETHVRLGLYLMTAKGLAVLKRLLAEYGPTHIAFVVTAPNNAVEYDGHEEISSLARNASIPVYSRSETPQQQATCLLAISWRWLIKLEPEKQLVIFHDSLLPRYRGFTPLVSALINSEKKVGVTALFASEEYDRGPIISQESVNIRYPITISEAIQLIIPCYEKLVTDVVRRLFQGKLVSYQQDDSAATYSLWRDDDDYYVNWSWSAQHIQRFIDAVGFPYKGAAVILDGKVLRIRESTVQPDAMIENRTVGKVIFSVEGKPVVVCGQGLLKILRLTEEGSEVNLLPLPRFRTRFVERPTK